MRDANALRVRWNRARDHFSSLFRELSVYQKEMGNEAFAKWCFSELGISVRVLKKTADILAEVDATIAKEQLQAAIAAEQRKKASEQITRRREASRLKAEREIQKAEKERQRKLERKRKRDREYRRRKKKVKEKLILQVAE